MISKLLNRLFLSTRQLIAVIGCQGVGKTSAMNNLECQLNHVYYSQLRRAIEKSDGKQPSGLRPDAIAFNYSDLESYLNLQASSEDLKYYVLLPLYMEQLDRFLRFKGVPYSPEGKFSVGDAEIVLGAAKTRTARAHALQEDVRSSHHFLVDLPDYGRTDRRRMARDLHQTQALWRNIMGGFHESARVVKDDPKDDIVVNTAVDGKAEWIVSGDAHLRKMRAFRGMRIVNPRQMLRVVSRRFGRLIINPNEIG